MSDLNTSEESATDEQNDRRWLGFIAMTALTTALLWMGEIQADHWADVTPWFFFTAAGAEVGGRWAAGKARK